MHNMEQIKSNWKGGVKPNTSDLLDKTALQIVLKRRVKKQVDTSLKYFWASLVFQIIVYGMLTHVIIRYWPEPKLLLPGMLCLLLYVPFTLVLMRKFKRMAILTTNDKLASDLSIKEYVHEQYRLLTGFYRFKIRYEFILVPLSSAVFVWIFFTLYLPGGLPAYPLASILVFTLVLGACTSAILAENNRNIKKPLRQLEAVIEDIKLS